MRSVFLALVPALTLGLLAPAKLHGQGPSERSRPLSLKAGDPLPDVRGYSETGKPIDLRQWIDGHHAVIVFGCLT